MREKIIVSEIFGPTLQGEGPLIGRPTLFVRTGGCDFRCAWCDSMHAVDERKHGDEWEEMTTDDVFDSVLALSKGFPMLISLSGGNPALQPLGALIDLGHENDYTFALETQGSVARGWFSKLDYLILSPKGPSSGMAFRPERFEQCVHAANDGPEISIKVVVFGEQDYQFARRVRERWPAAPIYLQAGTPQLTKPERTGFVDDAGRRAYLTRKILEGTRWLAARAAEDHWHDVTILPQLHVILWGDERGV